MSRGPLGCEPHRSPPWLRPGAKPAPWSPGAGASRLRSIRGQDPAFQVAPERSVRGSAWKADPERSGTAESAGSSVPQRLPQVSADFSHCKVETCPCPAGHSHREEPAHPPHCPVLLTAPGSTPAPNDSHLPRPPCPLYPSKPTIISLFFSTACCCAHPEALNTHWLFPLPAPSLLSSLLSHAVLTLLPVPGILSLPSWQEGVQVFSVGQARGQFPGLPVPLGAGWGHCSVSKQC